MISWVVILPLLKKFGPWIAVLLLLVGIYSFGYSRGSSNWEGKYDSAIAERDIANTTAVHNGEEVVRLRVAVTAQNDSILKMQEDQSVADARVRAAHAAELRRQATSYQRAVDAARAESAGLQSRMALLTVAETCHEAWLEMAQ